MMTGIQPVTRITFVCSFFRARYTHIGMVTRKQAAINGASQLNCSVDLARAKAKDVSANINQVFMAVVHPRPDH
jgi:hypothetical protein